MGDIISRSEAMAGGLKRFFTGEPCKNGHICERSVSKRECLKCRSEKAKLNRLSDLDGHRAKLNKWRRDNPDKVKASRRNNYLRYIDARRAYARVRVPIWRRNNPEKKRIINRALRAKKRSAIGSHTAEQILEMLTKQNWKCVACGISIKDRRHIDHIMPLHLGGSNNIENLQGLCQFCNCSKHAKDPFKWAQENGRLL